MNTTYGTVKNKARVNGTATAKADLFPGMHTVLNKVFIKAFAIGGIVSLAAALWILPTATVRADEAADVSKLIRAGQLSEGMAKVDSYLAQKPRDAQMRFLKGVLLTEMNKPNDAIQIFTKLTEDYPDLPEPYNNLAVLYASSSQYDKARAALDQAIRTNPSYATAYENLGDVHARLASQAYDKALQLDSKNTAAKSKLTMLLNIGTANNKAVPAPAAPVAPVVVAKAPTPAPATVATAPAINAAQLKPAPVQAAPAKPPVAAPVVAAKPVNTEQDDVLRVLNSWAKAWSARDVKAYLDHYAGDFQTPGGISHKAWADERTARIQGKGRITVTIETPQVSINGNTATVNFRQIYTSDRLKANSRKTLVMEKKGKQWQIKQERAGS
jgi:tetratricopeptide (TPR) repeat protein